MASFLTDRPCPLDDVGAGSVDDVGVMSFRRPKAYLTPYPCICHVNLAWLRGVEMDDINFEGCKNFPQAEIKTSNIEYVAIADAFKDNIERIHFIAELPVEINYWSQYFAVFLHTAHQELGAADGDEASDEVNKLANVKLQDFIKRRDVLFAGDKEALAKHQWEIGSSNFSSLMHSDASGELRKSAQALFASMLVSSWAALETLCIDLWVSALNKHPKSLGMRVAQMTRNQKVSLEELAGMGFNLSGNIGEFLYRGKKVNLEKFKYVQEAYRNAFGDDWVDVFAKHPFLRTVETVRHLFAHRAGRVDQRFLDRCTTDILERIGPQIDQIIEMDGGFVAECIENCIECGKDLILFVDQWSSANGGETQKI